MQYRSDQSQHGYEEARENVEESSIDQGGGENSPDWMDTLKSVRAEIKRFKEDNERVERAQERQPEVNEIIWQRFLDLQRQGDMSWGLVIETSRTLWNQKREQMVKMVVGPGQGTKGKAKISWEGMHN